jgi:hypothetical protein
LAIQSHDGSAKWQRLRFRIRGSSRFPACRSSAR